jgi:hypothetical protein
MFSKLKKYIILIKNIIYNTSVTIKNAFNI